MKSDTNSKDHSRVGSSRRITVEEMEMLEVTFYSPSGRGGTLLRKEGWLNMQILSWFLCLTVGDG